MPKKPVKLTPKDIQDLRANLLRARAVLTGDLSQLHEEAFGANGVADSSESKAGDTSDGYYQEFNLQLLERDESTLREIVDALERLDSGSFGKCEACENMIAKDRLRAMPHARLCIECQRHAERRGW